MSAGCCVLDCVLALSGCRVQVFLLRPTRCDRRLGTARAQGTTEEETQQEQTETTEESSSAPSVPSVTSCSNPPRLRVTFSSRSCADPPIPSTTSSAAARKKAHFSRSATD